MAQVTYNSIRKFRYYGKESGNEGENSKEETLRDALLEQILRKQSKTNLNIEDCFKNREKFTSGAKQEDFSHSARGLLTNETFKNVCNEFDVKEILASCELDDNEIDILLDENSGRGEESDEAYFQKLRNVALKLQRRQTRLEEGSRESFSSALQLNRHEFEEECRKMASDTAEKLTPCLVQLKPHSDPTIHPDHPINRLSDLEKDLFPESQMKTLPRKTEHQKISSPRKRRLKDTVESTGLKYFKEKPESLWDLKERPVFLTPPTIKQTKGYGCVNEDQGSVPKNFSVFSKKSEQGKQTKDYSKPFVWRVDTSKLVPLALIKSNKMTIDQIKKESKFSHYNPGVPSSTLYLKNLPHKIMPISIVSLFGHFEHENCVKIEYRILKGKMKGQAFVKFSNIETAVKAFSLCNGYILQGKPLVMEYSKKAV